MKIITKQEIEGMYEALHPTLEIPNTLISEDECLFEVLKKYLFLKQYAQDIIDHFQITYEEILYSQYFWFVSYKNQYLSKVGYDEGLEQQNFIIIEKLHNELDGNVDWKLIEEIECGIR